MKRNDFLKKLIKIMLAFLMWGFLGLLLFLRFANVGHCASANNNGLPFIVTNENTSDYASFNAIFYSKMGYSITSAPDGSFGYDFYEGGRHYYCIYIPTSNSSYSFTLSADYAQFDITQNRCDMTCSGSWRRLYWHNAYGGTGFYGADGYMSDFSITFFQGSNKGNGSALVPNISTVNFNYDDDIYKPVFGFGVPSPPWGGTGHSTGAMTGTQPDYQGSNLSQFHNVPPTYTINNYTWTTPQTPPFDDTDVLSAIESLKDIVVYWFVYLTQNLSASFNNLISNIGGFIAFVGDTIGYWAELLRQNIVDGINTLIDNISSLFDPIAQNIAYILEPVDFDSIKNEFQSTYIYTDISTINSSFTSFKAVFDNTSEPNSYVIPINLQNIPILHSDVQYIDLGDFLPVRPLIRTFAWVITTFSIFFTVIDSLPNYINGGGNE